MIRFSLFGIPVEVQPFFWVMSALMGGALNADSKAAVIEMALFVIAAFISILIHELGHALTGRRLGGGHAKILLTTFGGLAFNHGGRFNRQQRFWMIAAGPGAGFVFLIVILAVLALAFNGADVMALTARILFDIQLAFHSRELLSFLQDRPYVFLFINHLLWINFWWGVINLLPVMPLDGGQITDLYVRPQRLVFLIGLIAGASMAALAFLWLGSTYTALLFGYLAWQNYKNMQEVRWQ
ncbi:MAG: site-2 protease family protein [Verrucomicrobiota bacterium]